MRILQKKYSAVSGWEILRDDGLTSRANNLVLVFGCKTLLADQAMYDTVRQSFPEAILLMASTAGEIIDTQVNDNSISLTAIQFEKTKLKTAVAYIGESSESFDVGQSLGAQLPPDGLRNVFVVSDGQRVNGSDLVLGLQQALPEGTIITGGLAGDGAQFTHTLVGLNEPPMEDRVTAVGFYGEHLTIAYGSVGGWDSFGPERLITRSDGNVLYELDNKPALDIYKLYLGEYAADLPGSGLLFPLSIRTDEPGNALARTILAVSETDKSLTFAGNIPQGTYARLMKANFERLIEGASTAALNSVNAQASTPDIAILISCVGRKLVLNQRIEEEVEVIRAIYGDKTALAGFYSYGEISPTQHFMKRELHNQTMTITTFTEDL